MAERRAPTTAPELLLKIVLTGTQTHYEAPGLIDDKRLEHLLHAGKQILYKSHQESDVRQSLGFSPQVWEGLTNVLHKALPVLEQQSFSWRNQPPYDYSGSSSDLIAANYFSIVKDIERVNDLCTIARNLLATTRRAQNLAASKAFDQQILKLIDICVRVTARGFDGDTNARSEEKWQKVVHLYKRLLITCLQFLHNFIMHNEHRKLVLWLDLFGNTSAAAQQAQQSEIQAVQHQMNLEGKLSMHAEVERIDEGEAERQVNEWSKYKAIEAMRGLEKITAADLGYNIEDVHALFELLSADRVLDPASQEKKRVLMDKIRTDLERMSGLTAAQLDDNPDVLLRAGAALREHLAIRDLSARTAARVPTLPRRTSTAPGGKDDQPERLPDLVAHPNLSSAEQDITEDDLAMPRTSESAAETLQEAKDELMARLQDNQPILDENGEPVYEEEADGEDLVEDSIVDSAAESVEEEEEEEDEPDDYTHPGDQERGLLTDVPLVLGPTEIEALPMIIQAGIVDNFASKNNLEQQGARNMQAVRCHILLAQEAGRNVLRELLIFIAAWDLPDDEFYFKMMVQIMEAILKNGLMSHAYSDFGQAKDIISPAQAVVIKILTHIFRAKYSPAASQNNNSNNNDQHRHHKILHHHHHHQPNPLSRVDVLTVRYIFTVFRGNIIPETCALIYLQGQIRDDLAIAEDFPLNLWDMERVYEGVYQFLEFFAVLTENNDWKRLLIDWEIVYDLVTLIKELDASIPKATLTSQIPAPGIKPAVRATNNKVYQAPQQGNPTTTNSLAENPCSTPLLPDYPAVPQFIQSPSLQQPHAQRMHSKPTNGSSPPLPSLFEWRNLKKLIILVLSSLVWKSPIVQDQIRLHGGVETILSCTQYDSHNPYIKEHAVMCLKFLLEENAENQKIVSELEARGVANGTDLEKDFGVKANLNSQGRVVVEQKHQNGTQSKAERDQARQNFLAQEQRMLSEQRAGQRETNARTRFDLARQQAQESVNFIEHRHRDQANRNTVRSGGNAIVMEQEMTQNRTERSNMQTIEQSRRAPQQGTDSSTSASQDFDNLISSYLRDHIPENVLTSGQKTIQEHIERLKTLSKSGHLTNQNALELFEKTLNGHPSDPVRQKSALPIEQQRQTGSLTKQSSIQTQEQIPTRHRTVSSRPVRRASDSAFPSLSPGRTTAARLTEMTDRFHGLDMRSLTGNTSTTSTENPALPSVFDVAAAELRAQQSSLEDLMSRISLGANTATMHGSSGSGGGGRIIEDLDDIDADTDVDLDLEHTSDALTVGEGSADGRVKKIEEIEDALDRARDDLARLQEEVNRRFAGYAGEDDDEDEEEIEEGDDEEEHVNGRFMDVGDML